MMRFSAGYLTITFWATLPLGKAVCDEKCVCYCRHDLLRLGKEL